jgi:hypothetical protein
MKKENYGLQNLPLLVHLNVQPPTSYYQDALK